jgi:hypothetical protein
MLSPKRNEESPVSDIQSVVAELFPDQVNQITNIWGFVKDFRNDPYAGACTVAAKLGHLASNGWFTKKISLQLGILKFIYFRRVTWGEFI